MNSWSMTFHSERVPCAPLQAVACGGSLRYGLCPEHRHVAFYSSQRRSGEGGGGRGLLGRFMDNLRKDLETNKELEVSVWGGGGEKGVG